MTESRSHIVTPAPAGMAAHVLSGVTSRFRWLWLTITRPALRGQSRPSLSRGTWAIRGTGSVHLGSRARFADGHYIFVQGALSVGEDFYANRNFYLCCMTRVTLGNRVRCGERVSIHDENHVMEPLGPALREQRHSYRVRPIDIGDDVWLGANVIVLQGVSIGANTVVAANSVVTRDLPANVLAAGSPARPLRKLTISTAVE